MGFSITDVVRSRGPDDAVPISTGDRMGGRVEQQPPPREQPVEPSGRNLTGKHQKGERNRGGAIIMGK